MAFSICRFTAHLLPCMHDMGKRLAKQLFELRNVLFELDPENVDGGFFDRASVLVDRAEHSVEPKKILTVIRLLEQDLQQYTPIKSSQALGELHQKAFAIASTIRADLEAEISGRSR